MLNEVFNPKHENKPGPKIIPAVERFMDKVSPEPMTGCWLWTAAVDSKGYGLFKVGGECKDQKAYRFSYRIFKGTIPEDLELDHKCRVRCCVNPDHLEIVTSRENTLRSPISVAGINARKLKCSNGHQYVTVKRSTKSSGKERICRQCKNTQAREARRARNAQSDIQ